jgi:selenocysteine-specific translation elongation factor
MAHWWTIPEGMSVAAMSSATDDQLRVLGWDLKSPNQRVLAIVEAKQRRERPDLRKKVEDEGALSAAEFSEWIAPLNALQGRKFIHEPVDQMHEDVFGR